MSASYPVPNVPTIKSNVFDGLDAFLAERQLPVRLADVLAEVGLDRRLAIVSHDAEPQSIPLNPVSQLFERIAQLANRPCLGLEFAEAYPIGAFGFLLSHAPSIRDAIANLLQFVPTYTHPVDISFHESDGGTGYIEWHFALEFTQAMPQFISFALGAVIVRLRQIAGADWVPLRVELTHRPLACRDIYTRLFGPNVLFEAPANKLWFDPTTLAKRRIDTPYHARTDGPAVSLDRLYNSVIATKSVELRQVNQPAASERTLRERLRDHLAESLSSGAPALEQAAAALGVTVRQMQYALERDGTAFSDELSDVRRMTAERLLISTDKSMSEIATALGFAELSSFTRAARENWFGMSPTKFRARMRGEPSSPTSPPPTDSAEQG